MCSYFTHEVVTPNNFLFYLEPVLQGSAASKSMGPMGQRHPGAEGKQVYVGNLSWDTEWQALKVGNPPSVALRPK